MRKAFFILLLSAYSLQPTAFSQSVIRPLAWELNTARPALQEWPLVRGETVDLECRYLAGAAAMDVRGATVVLHARTNGMPADVSFQVTGRVGRVSSTNLASVGWVTVRVRPDLDLPNNVKAVTFTLDTTLNSARNLVASGTLRLSGDPTGASPAALPVFQYDARGSAQAVSNALASAIQTALSGVLTNETDAAAKALLGTHTNRTDNPHRVTAVQIGALTNETDARALAALATNRVTRLYSPDATQWIDGTGGVWKVSQSTATAYRITDAYDVGAWQAGDEFYFVSDTTVTNSPYVTRTISYGNLFHVRYGYINNTWDGFGQWGLYVNAPGGFDDCYGDYEYPSIGTLYPGNVDPYVTLESFQKTFMVTNVVDAVQRVSDKELHRDSYTNLIWRVVWSNGWCWSVAHTNTP